MKNRDYNPLPKLADLIYNFLAERGQTDKIPELISLLSSRYDRLPKDQVEIITAAALSARDKDDLLQWLRQEFGNLRFKFVVKKDILAGIVIKHRDKILDLSLKTRLNKIKKELKYESK